MIHIQSSQKSSAILAIPRGFLCHRSTNLSYTAFILACRRITSSNSCAPSCPFASQRAPSWVMLAKSEPVMWMCGWKSWCGCCFHCCCRCCRHHYTITILRDAAFSGPVMRKSCYRRRLPSSSPPFLLRFCAMHRGRMLAQSEPLVRVGEEKLLSFSYIIIIIEMVTANITITCHISATTTTTLMLSKSKPKIGIWVQVSLLLSWSSSSSASASSSA